MLTIHKYASVYKDMFQVERDKIANILVEDYLIEHVGSTSIPDLDGKGVIDILLIFKTKKAIKSAVSRLKENYYLSDDNVDRNDRIFMASSNSESLMGDIHLHLVLDGSEDHQNAILFRDYLISHLDVKQAYMDLKYDLKQKVGDNRAEYTKLKGNFIKKIIAEARTKV